MAAPMPVPKSMRRDQEVGAFSAPLGAGVDAEWGSYICPPRRKVPVQEYFLAVSFLGERIGSAALLDQGGFSGGVSVPTSFCGWAFRPTRFLHPVRRSAL